MRIVKFILGFCAFFCVVVPSLAAGQSLRYAGATTLQRHFMPRATQVFESQTGIRWQINGGNTGSGLKALREGRIDLAGSGRFLTAEEKELGLVETLIGWDPLVAVVNGTNPIEGVSLEQLRGIYAGTVRNWQEVGGTDRPILVVTCPPGSGMHAAVQEMVLDGGAFTSRQVVSAVVADADRQVANIPLAICVISHSMADVPGNKVLRINGLLPDEQSVSDGRYPLIKPLLLVTRGRPTGATADFIDFALSEPGQEILSRSFFPARSRYSR